MAIANRPYNIRRYVSDAVARLAGLEARAEAAKQAILRHEASGDMLLRSWLRTGTRHADAADEVFLLASLAARLETALPLARLRRALECVGSHGGEFARYVVSASKDVEPLHERYLALFAILEAWEAGARDYGYDPGHPTPDDDPDAIHAEGLVKAAMEMRSVFAEAAALVDDIGARFGTWQAMRAHAHDIESWRPPHGEVEPLWHASAFAPELVAGGFEVEKPAGRRGLNSLGSQSLISFTHEPEVAYVIADCLRELWAVAHGHLTASDIIARLRADGVDEAAATNCLGLGKPLHAVEGTAEVAKLWNVHLALSPKRDNPFFSYVEETAEMLKGRSLSDIGVVVCDVRLTGDEEYKWAESEFVVPPSRVLAVYHDPDAPGPERVGLDPDLEPASQAAPGPR